MTQEFLSVDEIITQWQIWKDLYDEGQFKKWKALTSAEVKNEWWIPEWIPLTHDGSGNHYMIDLSPGKEGDYGQIIKFWHDSSERIVVASSISSWLSDYVEDLNAGKYHYDKTNNTLAKPY